MPPETTEETRNQSAKLFGLGREPKRPGDPLVVTDETTAWEIYNHKASEVDGEMIKDWNDSLNTLLIFTALYSAVLTAFIIESMKLLEEDPAETTRDILLIISRQLANSSFPAFEPTTYETPQYAIVVNGLFFTSLSCALIAALLAVLALQWVANYDMGLNTSAPEKRALQRHIRFRGIEKWKMSELIASLPLLIFVALFLFFIGIADWLWHMNRAISGIVIGGIGIGCLLYTITNLISIINLDAPFRTPVSKELAVFVPRVVGWLCQAIINFPSTICRGPIPDQAVRHTIEQQLTFTKREENMFDGKGKGTIALDGLLWLANHIEISLASQDIFITLIKGLTEVPASLLMDEEKKMGAPWKAVFEMLCTPYIGKSEYSADEFERAMWICKGMGIIPYFESPTFERLLTGLRYSSDGTVSGMSHFASYKQRDRGVAEWESGAAVWIGRAFEFTNKAVSQIGDNYLHFMLLNAKREWPNMDTSDRAYLAGSMADAWTIPYAVIQNGSSSNVLPTDSIELILDLVIPGDGVDKIDARYLAAIQPSGDEYWDREWNDALFQVLRMMTQHLILQISRKYDTFSDFTKELKILSLFMDAKRMDVVKEKDNFIWAIVNKFAGKTGDERQRILDIICKGLYTKPFALAWVDLILAVDGFVTRLDPHSFHIYPNFIQLIATLYEYRVKLNGGADLGVLTQVRDPCIAWIASWYCPDDIQFQALVHPNFSEWNATIEQGFSDLFKRYSLARSLFNSETRTTFLRALILDSSLNVRIIALYAFYHYQWQSTDGEKCHRLFTPPLLSVALEQSVKSDLFFIRSLLKAIAKFRWFYDEFSQANGLNWLPLIALNPIHLEDQMLQDNVLTEILVDQILSSRANRDVQAPLSSSYLYLQSIGQSHNPRDHYELANLRTTLLWLLNNSTKVHDLQGRTEESSPLVFDPPGLEREDWRTVRDIRSFDFVKDMYGEEWEDWVTKLKVMIMGTSLGWLKPGPLQDRNRFCRDPDGFCGRV
ncbi:hypothetical protein CPB86DRAFT_873943 [Serendipita vermifera]|nr:hypothetical protein CPB86DRAFT_873943 [Serendipita vermifera]